MLLEVIFDNIGDFQQVHCIAPLLPPVIVGIGGLIGIIITYFFSKKKPVKVETIKENGICILGPELSGKTQLLSALRGVSYTEFHHSQMEKYKEFEVFLAGEKIKVKAGFDIGGEEYRVKSYPKLIENSDIIFFTFDSYEYLNNPEYRTNDVNARLFFIHKHIGNKPTVIFGTHLDKFAEGDRKNIIKRILNTIKNEKYSTLLEDNFTVMDLRETDKLNDYLKDIIIK